MSLFLFLSLVLGHIPESMAMPKMLPLSLTQMSDLLSAFTPTAAESLLSCLFPSSPSL